MEGGGGKEWREGGVRNGGRVEVRNGGRVVEVRSGG